MTAVYLVPAKASEPDDSLAAKVERLWHAAALASAFRPRDLAALKLHVGEPGTKTFVRPVIARTLVRLMAGTGAQPFLTDTAVLYKSERDNAVTHARVVEQHGFGFQAVGAPFVPGDGLVGADEIELPGPGKHFERVALAAAILQARSMLVLSHVTGHLGTGFAAALKNLGMGCASRKGKLRQHQAEKPHIRREACTACGTCAEWCPENAITVEEYAVIDQERCIGCGECVAVCREGATELTWDTMGRPLQERVVEHAAALVRAKPGRIVYVTVAQQITKDCDCMGVKQRPLVEDIGILASHDPVAIDTAAYDLVKQRAGRTLESMAYPRRDGSVQLEYAESLGMGTRAYELITLEA